MGKIMLIDEKKNTTIIEANPQMLKMLGVKQDEIKQHKSFRQLYSTISKFIKN